jgi:hypothetical protein
MHGASNSTECCVIVVVGPATELVLAHPVAYISLPPLALLFPSLALFAFWLRSSVVSVLFSLISETFLREHSRLFLFLKPADGSLGLLTAVGTVSPVFHYLWPTRLFSLSIQAAQLVA